MRLCFKIGKNFEIKIELSKATSQLTKKKIEVQSRKITLLSNLSLLFWIRCLQLLTAIKNKRKNLFKFKYIHVESILIYYIYIFLYKYSTQLYAYFYNSITHGFSYFIQTILYKDDVIEIPKTPTARSCLFLFIVHFYCFQYF